MNIWVNDVLRGLCKALCGAIMVLEKRCPSTAIYLFLFTSLTSGQRGTLVWVHRASLPGLRVPGCRGTGDRSGHRHRQRAVFCLGTHDHRTELPGRLPVRQVEHQGWMRVDSLLRHCAAFIEQRSTEASPSSVFCFSHQLQLIPVYERGSQFQPSAIEMADGQTSPPQLLTEADLIALMEKHGIGKTRSTRPCCHLSKDFTSWLYFIAITKWKYNRRKIKEAPEPIKELQLCSGDGGCIWSDWLFFLERPIKNVNERRRRWRQTCLMK